MMKLELQNDGPMIYCADSPSYRSVKIELTEEQKNKLNLRWICKINSINGSDSIIVLYPNSIFNFSEYKYEKIGDIHQNKNLLYK